MVEQMTEDHGSVPKSWIVQALMTRHDSIDGTDADWYRGCAYDAVDADVRRVLSEKKQRELDDQPTQEDLFGYGFAALQRNYVIMRDGESTVVSVEALTDDEIESKAMEHERAASGHLRHAEELRRFGRERVALTGGIAG
jgi:hypothetical protein